MITEQTRRTQNNVGLILGIVGFVVICFGIYKIYIAEPSTNKIFTEAVNDLNKKCPMMIDDVTRLDNVAWLPGNSFLYNYTLTNMEVGKRDTMKIKKNII